MQDIKFGDPSLRGPQCYAIDAARNELTLNRAPVFEIKVLAAAAHD